MRQCTLLLCFSAIQAAAAQCPNLLFILADDLGWQDTSVPFARESKSWNGRYRTPALERLTREGMKFSQAYSCAVCSPSRVSLLTGQNEAAMPIVKAPGQRVPWPADVFSQ